MYQCKKTNNCFVWPTIIVLILLLVILVAVFSNLFQVGGIQAELTGAGGEILADGANVIFDNVVNDQSTAIDYNAATGEFTITRPGNYLVSWWFAADGAGPAITVDFAVAVNGVPYAIASSPIVSAQISGDALVTVTTVPTVITLVNVTNEGVFIPMTTVQANIVITEIAG